MTSSAAPTPWKRIVAAILDSIVAAIPAAIVMVMFSIVNGNLGTIGYALVWGLGFGLRDALPIPALNGASIGKKVLGLQAVRGDGSPCDYESSIKRNAPLMVWAAFSLLSGLIGLVGIPVLPWILTIIGSIVGLVVMIVETYKIFTAERGLRIGDLFASTYVVEHGGSVVDQVPTQPPPPPAGANDSESQAPPPPPPA